MQLIRNCLLLCSLLFLIVACGKIETNNEIEEYTICLGEFLKYEEADLFKSKIDFKLWDKLKIKTTEEKYFLIYGNYSSSFEAGKKGFELFSEQLINNYKILYNEKYVFDEFSNVLFIARYQGRPSVYNYNMITKQSKLFWSRWGRKVVTLNHSRDRSHAFFVTALGFGKQGSFPYIRDVRVYRFTTLTEQVEELDELDDGLQVYTYWDNKDTFKVNITKPDSIRSDLLVQEIYSYLYNGKSDKVNKRYFNLAKDGFPKPPVIQPRMTSNSNYKLIRLAKLDSETYIYLKDLKNASESMICNFKGNLYNTLWSNDDKYLFLITREESSKANLISRQELMIIDTEQKKLLKTFHGNFFQNILINGNFLFYENIKDGEAVISVYDIKNDDIYHVIKIPGGCGLNNLNK